MKKILLSILFLALSFGSISENVFSADAGETTTMLNGTEIDNTNSNPDQSAAETARLNGQNGSTTTTTVIVTEKVPGVKCDPIDGTNAETPVEKRKYACTVKSGLAGFQWMLAAIVRWFVYLVLLFWVLAIVWLGIAWSMAGGDDAKAKTALKKWAINILVGMIILFFFRYILQFLAPWVFV